MKVRPNLELTQYKTRIDEHLSCVPVHTSHACETTATVSSFAGDLVVVAHIGDTRALFRRKDGVLTHLYEDHMHGRNVDLERTESAGELVIQVRGNSPVNSVLAVSGATGDLDLKELVIARLEVSSFFWNSDEEFVHYASDGLRDVESERGGDSIRYAASRNAENYKDNWEQNAVKALVECAWERESADDECVLVVTLQKHSQAWIKLHESTKGVHRKQLISGSKIFCF